MQGQAGFADASLPRSCLSAAVELCRVPLPSDVIVVAMTGHHDI
jgi:hypothetical protein